MLHVRQLMDLLRTFVFRSTPCGQCSMTFSGRHIECYSCHSSCENQSSISFPEIAHQLDRCICTECLTEPHALTPCCHHAKVFMLLLLELIWQWGWGWGDSLPFHLHSMQNGFTLSSQRCAHGTLVNQQK